MKRALALLVAAAAILGAPAVASALPRFAARNGNECIQCHVNPTGGGIRNAYGRNVFEKAFLPWSARQSPTSWLADDYPLEGDDHGADPDPGPGFSGDVTEWLAMGADLRTAYIYVRPDHGPTPGAAPQVTSSFFLMQADLYHAVTIDDHLTLVLDVGVYSGFEAWGLYSLRAAPRPTNLFVKVGRFMPAFGIREVEHQLFTRERIGFGATDRDTGLELTGYAGPLTMNLALVNGTVGDTPFDTAGTERRSFEKAVAARLAARTERGWIRGQIGASFYANQDVNQANPLFGGVLPPALAALASSGLDEVRAGAFLTANVGRFTYLGDVALVYDDFYDTAVPSLTGYVSYQELSFVPVQGLDLVGTFEFMDPNVDLVGNATTRVGLVAELFPRQFTELRAMVRRTSGVRGSANDAWDFVLFAHLFL